MKKALLSLAICVVSFLLQAQNNQKHSLYVVHVDPSGKAQFKQRIYAYRFLNGTFTGRDEVISFMGRKDGKDYIRVDRGHNTLYKDRYLITGIGNIIDLVDKKVLFDGKANLLRCSNDSAVFYTNDVFKGKFYSVYDFKTNQYKEVKDLLFKPKLGRDVEFDKSSAPFKLIYYPQGKPKQVIVSDAGYGQAGIKDNYVPDPPMYWLDNDNFIYAYFNKDNTEVSFFKVNVDTKATTLVGKVSMTKESNPMDLYKASKGLLIMTLGNREYYVDVEELSIKEIEHVPAGNGFMFDLQPGPKGRVIKANGKEIGKYFFQVKNISTAENMIALTKELKIGTDTYQQGIMVWGGGKNSWEQVDADEVLTFIGLVKEK